MEAARLRVHARPSGDAARVDEPYLRPRRRFRVPRLSPVGAAAVAGGDPQRQQTVQRRRGADGAGAVHGGEVLGRRRHADAAGDDRRAWPAVSRDHAEPRARPDRDDQQRVRAAAVRGARSAGGARAQRPRAGDGHQVARVSGTGRRRPVDDAHRPGKVRDRSAADGARAVDAGPDAGERARDADPGRRRRLRGRLRDYQEGRGVVLRARRLELGLPVQRDRAPRQGLRRRDHDQRRCRAPGDQRDRSARRRRLRLGFARQTGPALNRGTSIAATPAEDSDRRAGPNAMAA